MNSSNGFFLHFHLLVTGEGEEDHLPKLFSKLAATGVCRFVVERRIRQLTPRFERLKLEMLGRGGKIPSRAETEISFPARKFLRDYPERFLILIDDLEHDRRGQVESIFNLYRESLDKLLQDREKQRVAVHFLVNMLEAYFFADPGALAQALGLEVAHSGDVEEIQHPKNLLKQHFPNYREREHSGQILKYLNLHQVLADPTTCSWLRSCTSWIVRALHADLDPSLHPVLAETVEACHLEEGKCVRLTLEQAPANPLPPST